MVNWDLPFIEPLQPELPILPESRQGDLPTEASPQPAGQRDLFASETAARDQAHAALIELNATRALELLADWDVVGDDPGASLVRRVCRRLDGRIEFLTNSLIETLALVESESAGSSLAHSLKRGLACRLAQAPHLDGLATAPHPVLAVVLTEVWPAEGGYSAPARALVRDLLLRGSCLGPGMVPDRAVKAVLAEDRHPVWLASIGAIRGVWRAAHALTDHELARLTEDPIPTDEAGRAHQFWFCLAAGSDQRVSLERRSAARRRMKALDADLHAQRYGT